MQTPRLTTIPTDRAALEVAILASELGVALDRERPAPPASITPPGRTDPQAEADGTTDTTTPTQCS